MRVECECGPLLAAVAGAAKVVPARTTRPALQCVRLTASTDAVTVEATDLEMSVRQLVPAAGGFEAGVACVSADRLAAVLSGVGEGPVALELVRDGKALRVKAGGDRWDLPAIDPAEFPAIDDADLEDRNWLTLPGEVLARLLTLSSWAAERKENAKYVVTATLIEVTPDEIACVATDATGMAAATHALDPKPDHAAAGMLPPRAVKAILSGLPSGPVELSVGKADAVVRSPGYLLRTRLVAGQFAPWRRVMPKAGLLRRVPIDPAALGAAVRRAVATGDKLDSACDFDLSPGRVVIAARSASGESEVTLALPGLAVTGGRRWDSSLIAECLKHLERLPDPAWELSDDANKPCVFRADGGRFAYLLAPMSRS